mmetsp:Transcript_6180/g.15372  ORF Transcript_6180/g.15372 Transcript_6180/m.15372 type:complete len:208 (-) Transcript_6180:2126-2749(-)
MRHRCLAAMAASTSSCAPPATGERASGCASRPCAMACPSSLTCGATARSRSSALRVLAATSTLSISPLMCPTSDCLAGERLADQLAMSSRNMSAATCCTLPPLASSACAALTMAVTNTPSTPNAVKKVNMLRVRRNGTASMRSSMPFSLYTGMSSACSTRPVSLANRILLGARPPSSSMAHSRPDSDIWVQKVFLKTHRWLQEGSVL